MRSGLGIQRPAKGARQRWNWTFCLQTGKAREPPSPLSLLPTQRLYFCTLCASHSVTSISPSAPSCRWVQIASASRLQLRPPAVLSVCLSLASGFPRGESPAGPQPRPAAPRRAPLRASFRPVPLAGSGPTALPFAPPYFQGDGLASERGGRPLLLLYRRLRRPPSPSALPIHPERSQVLSKMGPALRTPGMGIARLPSKRPLEPKGAENKDRGWGREEGLYRKPPPPALLTTGL